MTCVHLFHRIVLASLVRERDWQTFHQKEILSCRIAPSKYTDPLTYSVLRHQNHQLNTQIWWNWQESAIIMNSLTKQKVLWSAQNKIRHAINSRKLIRKPNPPWIALGFPLLLLIIRRVARPLLNSITDNNPSLIIAPQTWESTLKCHNWTYKSSN